MLDVKAWMITALERDSIYESLRHSGLGAYEDALLFAQNAKTIREMVEWLNEVGAECRKRHEPLEANALDHAAVLLEQAAIAAGYKMEEPS